MIDMISSIFYQNSKPLVFLPNVYAYIWRCDHPIEMGFAPKDGQFSDGVQRKKTRLIVVQEMGTFAQKLFPYLRRYKKEGKKREIV